MRRAPKHGLGSYDREYDYIEKNLEELLAVDARAKSVLARTHDALESGSASRLFKAKSANGDVLSKLSKTIDTARTAESASGSKLDRLPKHSPFDKAHRLMQEYRELLDRSERLKKRLIKVSYGDAAAVRAGLESERDRTRTRRRRRAWR